MWLKSWKRDYVLSVWYVSWLCLIGDLNVLSMCDMCDICETWLIHIRDHVLSVLYVSWLCLIGDLNVLSMCDMCDIRETWLIHIRDYVLINLMGWLRWVGSFKLCVSFAKEPYKRDYILQKRPMILSSLLIVATPYLIRHITQNCVCCMWYVSRGVWLVHIRDYVWCVLYVS